jgi:2-(1,2-epoxy-1,2-dihydrophenyl)acetyl-CoA isomerase
MTEPLVRLAREGDVAMVSLNRPARHNALVPELLAALLKALKNVRTRGAAALVLGAEGRSFSTGGDLRGFLEHRDTIGAYADQLVGLLNDVIMALYRLPLPTVCAVQGQVCGGSLGLLLACDRIVMLQNAGIAPWYRAVGFSPDGGWTAMLPGVIGRRQAAHWVLSDARYGAARCHELGLVQEVVADDVQPVALNWAREVATMGRGGARSTLSLLRGDDDGLTRRLDAEKAAFVRQVRSPEALAGIERFLHRGHQ